MFDDDIEILEDDEQNASLSNYSRTNLNIGSSRDSEKIKNTIDKNKETPGNKASKDSGKVSSNGKSGIDNGNQFKNAGNVANMSKGLSSNDPLEQAESLKNMGKEQIKPLVRKGVQAATGGLVGSDPATRKIINKAVDKVADSETVDKVVNDVVGKVKKVQNIKRTVMITKAILSIVAAFLPLIIVVAIINYLFLPVFGMGDYDHTKLNKYEKQYYEELDRIKGIYESKCGASMNSEIITTSIFYDQMFYNTGEDIVYDEEDGIDFSALEKISFKNKKDDIKKLASVLYPNFDFSNSSDDEEDDEEEISRDVMCKANYENYKYYLTSNYMRNNYKNLDGKTTYVKAADEILAMNGQYIIQNAYRGSYYCPGVTVERQDGTIMGTYDLETYVAGVVANEAYTNFGIEALKAQAIAARSFVLKQTDNCKLSIQSSQNAQVFQETTDSKAIQATKETEGLVLTYDDEILAAMYDSFCYLDSDCPDSTCDGDTCSVTYTKVPNGETHRITISSKWSNYFVPGGGHAFGMSQLASYQMAEEGYLYDEILYTFYSNGVEISRMTGLIQGGLYTSSSEPPPSQDFLREIASTNQNLFYNSSKGLVSQCPWYAKSRASEILYYSNLPEDLKDIAIKSISNTSGNGGDVVSRADEEIFQKSYDYTQPHPGSIISWRSSKSDGPNCHNYGHVAIIEQVNEDGTVVISDGWNGGGVHAANTWQNIRYRIRTKSIDFLKGYTNDDGCHYTFAGYVYLLG